jgi:hypothetical protein
MKSKCSLRVAVILSTLFLLQPVVTCAAMFQSAESAAHACCPRPSEQNLPKPDKECCLLSPIPPAPIAATGFDAAVWTSGPSSNHLATPRLTVGTAGPLSPKLATPHLFVRFHQLLI